MKGRWQAVGSADRRGVASSRSNTPSPIQPPHGGLRPLSTGCLVAACLIGIVAAGPARAQPAPGGGPVAKPWGAVLIASFNIQVFGESKLAKAHVVEVLARVVRHFDVVAIQEVRAKSDDVIPSFVRAVNADGSRYHYVIGPREGRTVSKEQYAFVYDTSRIEVDPSSVGVVPDPQGRLHRPPLHARFRTRITPVEMAFTFWLVDIHTDPDEVPQELEALTGVFQAMQAARPDEDDVILLGDLNAGPPEFRSFGRIPGVTWAVAGTTTNTRRTKTYDNLVFAKPATSEYLGGWGVVDLQSTFGLPLDHALEVSDHNPVWAAFYPAEVRPQPAAVAVGAAPALR
ncbi:MAG: endonuclease/exonuclease/phosphatase [Planctomycetia bacterium]|nr:endonuclease/exonuclease/phosphatase [Planctomycetia bacterium]